MERLTNKEYTPTTEEVRERYWINDGAISDEREGLEFDRWLRAYAESIYDEASENFGDTLQTPPDGTTTQEFRKAVIDACIAQGNPYRRDIN